MKAGIRMRIIGTYQQRQLAVQAMVTHGLKHAIFNRHGLYAEAHLLSESRYCSLFTARN